MNSRRVIPIDFFWDAESNAMIPTQRFGAVARRQYVDQRTYRLEVREDRSSKTHAHYFAVIKDLHDNLPEEKVADYPTPEHLRKWALVKCGYAYEATLVCDTPAHAKRMAAFMRTNSEFEIIVVKGNIVKKFTPMSQDVHSMDREQFKESKNKVLDLLTEMIGVTRATAEKHGGKSA